MYPSSENAYLPNSPITCFSPYCASWVIVAERNQSLVEIMSIQYQTAYNHAFKNEENIFIDNCPVMFCEVF